jgi:tRNA dimethylallyltransferase
MKTSEAGVRAAPLKNAVLIAGPTASGKSALALAVARETGGVIVNADSMQVYSAPKILTAQPTAADLTEAPHALYGHVDPGAPYSTGAWLTDVAGLIRAARFDGGPAIFVGGTGLYFKALLGGLSEMPEIPPGLRERWRDRLMREGPEALHRELSARDPAAADAIRPGDRQRIVRALEVLDASGRSIFDWRLQKGEPLVDFASADFRLAEADRPALIDRIDKRFDRMLALGAVEEVQELLALGLDPALPAMKAIGVREIAAALLGNITMADAIVQAKIATRQYAKRQATWFRTQFGPEWRSDPMT